MIVLGIETSCDDTSVALVDADKVLAMCSASKDLDHAKFGGIVPEIASRNHTEFLLPLIEELQKKSGIQLSQIKSIAVTQRPGLFGSLIVGIMTAKSLAQTLNIPWLGVNHLEGHIWAGFLKDELISPKFSETKPFLALAVSGGHTSLYQVDKFADYKILGSTLDDAAGEAFDKWAQMLGLGFPGGPKVDELAKKGDAKKFSLPRALLNEGDLNFSFSGLKASGSRLLATLSQAEIENQKADLCASFQAAILDVLILKLDRAVQKTGIRRVTITGGVSANSRLREVAESWAEKNNIELIIPPMRYCTDNAAMIAWVGRKRLLAGEFSPMNLSASASSYPEDFDRTLLVTKR